MACSSGCPTKDHANFGECLRSKNIQIGDVKTHKFATHQNKVIEDYVDARKSGMQPESVTAGAVKQAREITDKTGVPFRADQL